MLVNKDLVCGHQLASKALKSAEKEYYALEFIKHKMHIISDLLFSVASLIVNFCYPMTFASWNNLVDLEEIRAGVGICFETVAWLRSHFENYHHGH